MSKNIKHKLEFILFQLIGFFVRVLPLQSVHKCGFVLAKWFYPIFKSRRNVALRNLRNAFPEMNDDQRENIAYRSFQNITATFMELLWLPNMDKEAIKRRVHIENPELIERLLQGGKGLIYLTAHFGNWELAIQALGVYSNASMYAMAKTQSNSLVDEMIIQWREKFDVKIISMTGVREILRALHQGGIIGMAADQSAPMESISVMFFGREVPTFQGPAVFCLKTGAPMIFGCTVRQDTGNYKMLLEQVQSNDLIGASDENVLELTRRQVQVTENMIRKYPDQWMWMHKRWKHVPDRAEVG